MNIRRTIAVAALGLALAMSAAACGGSGGDSDTLRVASNSNASCLTVWVAIEEGIFEKHGIDVDYTKVENVGTLPPALGKSFDVVFITPVQAIAAVDQGISLTEIAGSSLDTAKDPNSYLMVSEDSSIKDLKGIEGKNIGVLTEVGTLHYATLNMLKQAGVRHRLRQDHPGRRPEPAGPAEGWADRRGGDSCAVQSTARGRGCPEPRRPGAVPRR